MTTQDASRRRFLIAGGASLVGAATLAACGSDAVVNSSGTAASTSVPPTAPPTTADAKALAAGQAALRTATSLELSLANFYEGFAKAAYLDATTVSWGTLIGGHHRANAAALAELTTTAGGKAYTKANTYVDTEIIAPQKKIADTAKSAEKLLELATSLEDVAASNCAITVGTLARAPERAGIMAIGGANARHAALWRLAATPGDFAGALPDALLSLRNALGAAAAVS